MSELHVAVCIKSISDPRCPVEEHLDPATGLVRRSADAQGIPRVISPLDRNALEAALRIKDERPAHVSVLTMDLPAAMEVLRQTLALGADRAVLLSDRRLGGADSLATARTLASAIRRLGPCDLVFCGAWSYHGNTGQVGPQLAELLGIAHVSFATELQFQAGARLRIRSERDQQFAVVEAGLPLLVTTMQQLNTPRHVSLMGIVQARSRIIEQWGLDELGLPAEAVGLAGSPSRVAAVAELPTTRRCEILGGTAAEAAGDLVSRLRSLRLA